MAFCRVGAERLLLVFIQLTVYIHICEGRCASLNASTGNACPRVGALVLPESSQQPSFCRVVVATRQINRTPATSRRIDPGYANRRHRHGQPGGIRRLGVAQPTHGG